VIEAEVVEAIGCDPVGSGCESHQSPLPAINYKGKNDFKSTHKILYK
jgi:hypothetical protein